MKAVDNVLQKSAELIMKFGVKSNTMDDVAKHLGISKKTLYQHFSNKEDMILKCAKAKFEFFSSALAQIKETSSDAIDELIQIDHFLIKNRIKRNPIVFNELQRYYPEIFTETYELHQSYVSNLVKSNIERGISEGLFRDDIEPNIIAALYAGRIEAVVQGQNELEEQYSFETIIQENLIYHIRGIATPQGVEKLQQNLTSISK